MVILLGVPFQAAHAARNHFISAEKERDQKNIANNESKQVKQIEKGETFVDKPHLVINPVHSKCQRVLVDEDAIQQVKEISEPVLKSVPASTASAGEFITALVLIISLFAFQFYDPRNKGVKRGSPLSKRKYEDQNSQSYNRARHTSSYIIQEN